MHLHRTPLSLSILLTSLVYKGSAQPINTTQSLSGNLFPPQFSYSNGFTTAANISVAGVSKVNLSDSVLGVLDASSGTTHNIVSLDNKTAWQAIYPQGSWNPSNLPRGALSVSTTSQVMTDLTIYRWIFTVLERD